MYLDVKVRENVVKDSTKRGTESVDGIIIKDNEGVNLLDFIKVRVS